MKILPLDLKKIKVLPLAKRDSLSSLDKVLVDPAQTPPPCSPEVARTIADAAKRISSARKQDAGVILMCGAHLVKNGAMRIVNSMVDRGWITHLATNGAGAIHDWEFSFLGRSEESVKQNVASGTFGAWDETGRNIHLALMAGGLRGEGYGQSLGRFIQEDGTRLPTRKDLELLLSTEPIHPLSPARAELLRAMAAHHLTPGRIAVKHRWKETSLLAHAFRNGVPFTVHPGIGYDIVSTHPMFRGAVIGRAAGIDFSLLGGAVETLDGGVVLSIGSAIMAPQVFEKSLSCVNNLRLEAGRKVVQDHTIYVVDIQNGADWDWSASEPPKDNPAYYLRFCKSFSRMGGTMKYVGCDNVAFLHNLLAALQKG